MSSVYNYRLSADAKEDLRVLLEEKEWKYRYEYGGSNAIKPCIRVIYNTKIQPNPLRKHDYNINGETIKFGDTKIKPYQASFAYSTGRTTKKYKRISHICGRPLPSYCYAVSWSACIEPTHLIQESMKRNNRRKRCHLFIRNYALKNMYKWTDNSKKTLFVSDVPPEEKVRIAKEFIKGKNKDMEQLGDYECNCTNRCFITYANCQYDNDPANNMDDESDSDEDQIMY